MLCKNYKRNVNKINRIQLLSFGIILTIKTTTRNQ